MKQITIAVPDNYSAENMVERIKNEFGDDPKIIVTYKGTIDAKVGTILQAFGEFQEKVKQS